jgi:hypothetical protein
VPALQKPLQEIARHRAAGDRSQEVLDAAAAAAGYQLVTFVAKEQPPHASKLLP